MVVEVRVVREVPVDRTAVEVFEQVGPWAGETTDEILAFYRDECERSRTIAAGASLDDLAKQWPADRPPEKRPNLRWIYVHMIDETARHAGHLDVVRELIDGATGD